MEWSYSFVMCIGHVTSIIMIKYRRKSVEPIISYGCSILIIIIISAFNYCQNSVRMIRSEIEFRTLRAPNGTTPRMAWLVVEKLIKYTLHFQGFCGIYFNPADSMKTIQTFPIKFNKDNVCLNEGEAITFNDSYQDPKWHRESLVRVNAIRANNVERNSSMNYCGNISVHL